MILIEDIFDNYYNAVKDTNRGKAIQIVDNAINAGISPEDIIFKLIIPSIDKMLKEFLNDQSVTISQHFIASKVAEEITDKMLPLFKTVAKARGTIVVGSAFGDFHGLGKKIVSGCLRANMFTVIDLGINVSPEKFVDSAVEQNSNIIGISTMMMHTAKSEKGAIGVRKILRERDLEKRIKIIVGGAPYQFYSELYKEVEADAWAANAIEAVEVIKSLLADVAHE